MIVYFLASVSLAPLMGLEHNLYKYGVTTNFTYSDMNGFGHFLPRVRVFEAYWAAAALLLAVVGLCVLGPRHDVRLARTARHRPPTLHAGRSPRWPRSAPSAMVALGGFIFWNTNVLNQYTTTRDQQARQADYEKKYKALAADAQPKIAAVKLAVDLFPREQRVRMKGRYSLQNRSGKPVDAIHLLFFQRRADALRPARIRRARPTLATDDPQVGLRSYRLATPLAPGRDGATSHSISTCPRAASPTRARRPTSSPTARSSTACRCCRSSAIRSAASSRPTATARNSGWLAKERMRDRDDPAGLAENALAPDADFIDFEATVGTDADQLAIAPGYLQREWTEGRSPLLRIQDGQPDPRLLRVPVGALRGEEGPLARRRDRGLVPARARVQPRHDDRGHEGRARLLHRQLRTLPAQAVPDHRVPALRGVRAVVSATRFRTPRASASSRASATTIPRTSTTRTTSPRTSSRTSGGATRCAAATCRATTMLVETLAQYSALMVMKQKYGEAKMQRFLRYELDRYLLGRSTEQKKELPLVPRREPGLHPLPQGQPRHVRAAGLHRRGEPEPRDPRVPRRGAFKGPPYPNAAQSDRQDPRGRRRRTSST